MGSDKQYARDNQSLADDHARSTNVVTRSVLFDILLRRSVKNSDMDARVHVLRLVKYYRHRRINGMSTQQADALPDFVFVNGLMVQLT